MKILLYNPHNGVTRNFMSHLWLFLLQSLYNLAKEGDSCLAHRAKKSQGQADNLTTNLSAVSILNVNSMAGNA